MQIELAQFGSVRIFFASWLGKPEKTVQIEFCQSQRRYQLMCSTIMIRLQFSTIKHAAKKTN